jgi:hypothetical protein
MAMATLSHLGTRCPDNQSLSQRDSFGIAMHTTAASPKLDDKGLTVCRSRPRGSGWGRGPGTTCAARRPVTAQETRNKLRVGLL